MLWENINLPRLQEELPLEQRFAGFSAGDNWVCAFKVSVDERGMVTPYACSYRFFKCPPDVTPSGKLLSRVLSECWNEIDEGDQLDWGRFVWILPPWASRSREVAVDVSMAELAETELGGPVAVMRDDRDVLGRLAVQAASEEGWIVTEMIPHGYVLNGRRRVVDPVGESARTLGIRAHAVLTEESALKDLMSATRDCGIDPIDALLSPCGISCAHLTTVERRRDLALIDVDRESCCCSILRGGRLVASGRVPLGSYSVLHETAAALGMRPRDFGRWLNEHEHVFVEPGRRGVDTAFSPFREGPASLEELDAACRAPGARLFQAIHDKVKDFNLKLGTSVHDLVVMGDDYLACRAVRSAGSSLVGVRCSWRRPRGQQLLLQRAQRVPGLARVVGAMQVVPLLRERIPVPVLDEYNKTVVDRFNDRLAGMGRRMWQKLRRRPWRRAAALVVAGAGKAAAAVTLPREQSWQVQMRRRRNSRFRGQFILE